MKKCPYPECKGAVASYEHLISGEHILAFHKFHDRKSDGTPKPTAKKRKGNWIDTAIKNRKLNYR